MKKARRMQEERSEEMKARILEAAFLVLKEDGVNGFTTAKVAERAGVSRGAQVHHFPSKNDLVAAAMEYVFNKSLATGLELAKKTDTSSPDSALTVMLGELREFYFSDYFYIGLEMLLAGLKDNQLRDMSRAVTRNYRIPAEERWRDVLLRAGLSDDVVDDILWMTVSLVRGFAIRSMWLDEPKKIDRLLIVWRGMVGAYVERVKAADSAASKKITPPAKPRRAPSRKDRVAE
jgi:AcrR family transcriptional regulator